MHLRALGWNAFFQDHWNVRSRDGLHPARVVEEQKQAYRIVSEPGELSAEVTGRLRHSAPDRSRFPAVGDWVAAQIVEGGQKALIHEVLPRRTRIARKVAGDRSRPGHTQSGEQILVANVDVVLIVMALNVNVSARLAERFLGTVRGGGAEPVMVLSKADLCPRPQEIADRVAAIAGSARVHTLSGMSGEGLEQLAPYIGFGQTVVLMGASGVGKSTIINRLLNSDVQLTREIREGDGRGRHTTTYRRMFLMPTGGVLIDTPGIRELHLWDTGGVEDAFGEIGQLAAECRFRDCQHDREPGCAVQQAIAAGDLDAERLGNYNQLRRELRHLETRRDLAARSEQRRRWKQVAKAIRRHYAERDGDE